MEAESIELEALVARIRSALEEAEAFACPDGGRVSEQIELIRETLRDICFRVRELQTGEGQVRVDFKSKSAM